MTRASNPPDARMVIGRLKDFQRASAHYVFERLFKGPDPVDRFLLADEVGLGKTKVAQGVIALAVDHLWPEKDRIDILYICSNADIARQNINRLALDGFEDVSLATRLTLMPLRMGDLSKRKLNFVSFTPGTSLDLGAQAGVVDERALLYCLMRQVAPVGGDGPWSLFQGDAYKSWGARLERFERETWP
ncbi:MAG: hypothetical protein FJZ00_11180, partial [Candidatus Sericytochromatia bacterium]|nr:hypothetical protein [Candidatus Tanganyikabacteria bacterium]